MNAYTSSSSSSAMSAARAAAGSWSTFSTSDPTFCWSGGRSRVIPLGEKISAQQVGGVRTLHVGTRVDDHVPRAVRGGIGRLDGRLDVHLALAVGNHLVQRQRDVPVLLAAADVDV